MKAGFDRNRVGDAGNERETIPNEVSKVAGCSGEARIPFLIWPVFAASRMAGLMPLAFKPIAGANLSRSRGRATGAPSTKRPVNQAPGLNISYPWLSLCILALCVSSYAFIVEFRRLLQLIVDPKSDLKDYVYAVPMLLNTAEGVVCVIRGLLAAKTLALCLHTALTSLWKISSLAASAAIAAGLAPPPAGTALSVDGCTLLFITFAYYSLVINAQVFYAEDHDYIASAADNAAYIWCRLVPVVVETQFLLVTLLAGRGLRALATAVENATSAYIPRQATAFVVHSSSVQPPYHGATSRTSLLVELRRLHLKVFGVMELANKYFGPQLLFMIIQTRIKLITDGYRVVSAALAPEGHLPFVDVLEACFLWIRIFYIIYRSEHVIQQDERIFRLVYTVDSSSWDPASSSQLHLLRRQVSALRPSINTCSFFTLDYNLLLSIVATTCTYLVVLVQFQG